MTLTLENSTSPRWIDLVQAGPAGSAEASAFQIYVAAFYFCSYTITSVGYGDISPQNNLERMICTAIVLFSGLAWAYIIGEVGAIVTDMTSEGQDFRRTMHHLNSMMKRQGLGFDLQCRLRRYFLQNRHQALTLERQSLMSRMSPQLQSTFCIAVNHRWLQKVTFLRKFMFYIREQVQIGSYVAPYEACMAEIARCLKLGAFAQQETFDNVQVLYILSKGLVVLNSKLRSEGEVWGEDFVLEDTSLILPVAGYAVTYLETLSLNREDFMSVIERKRFSCPQLKRMVRRYCVRIAVYRGILREAQRRRLQPKPRTCLSELRRRQMVGARMPEMSPTSPSEAPAPALPGAPEELR